MQYNFSEYFENNDLILNKFIENYTTYIYTDTDNIPDLVAIYKSIMDSFLKQFDEDDILALFTKLSDLEILLEKPYAIISNEIYCLQNTLIQHIISVNANTNANILLFIELFKKIDNKIAEVYLKTYIEKLLSINNVRINSLSDLVDRNIIKHYESHLSWLSALAKYVKFSDVSLRPELDERKCNFGKWLDSDGKNIIKNNSKHKSIKNLHKNLHMYGEKIQNYIESNEQHIVITFLEKCELLSLSIGTELALIDNIIMNKNVTKDKLTGAMNRHALENVFSSQYELSLATKNSFVIAMCDLDYFKLINDNYGHLCGDKVLKMFVETTKKFLRNSDIIIRYGGEEFLVILPAVSKDVGYEVLEKIRFEFSKELLLDGDKEIGTTVSMGLVEVNPECEYKKSYLDRYLDIADKNLYYAKNNGRNKIIKGSF